MKIYLKNKTDNLIDICCGADQEFTLEPGNIKAVWVQDGGYLYIDRVLEKGEVTWRCGGGEDWMDKPTREELRSAAIEKVEGENNDELEE